MANDSERDALNEANLLGEESLGAFWPGSGLGVLMTLVDEAPEALPTVRIKTDRNETIGVSEFLEKISILDIKRR
tara:strand:- start:5831 stop:6055 length:225 start_codon:yes stop_codon:yes gene_type:complete